MASNEPPIAKHFAMLGVPPFGHFTLPCATYAAQMVSVCGSSSQANSAFVSVLSGKQPEHVSFRHWSWSSHEPPHPFSSISPLAAAMQPPLLSWTQSVVRLSTTGPHSGSSVVLYAQAAQPGFCFR